MVHQIPKKHREAESVANKLEGRVVRHFASFAFCVVVGLFVARDTAAQAQQTIYAQEFRPLFKGSPENSKDFTVIGPNAEECVKFENAVLRITLPAGYPKERPGTGLLTRFGVEGNFEITMAYEILHEPEPNKTAPQTRLTLGVFLDRANPAQYRASLNRRWAGVGPQFLTWMAKGPNPEKKEKWHTSPAEANVGKLRLTRRGEELSYFVADGVDAQFELLQKLPFGAENLRNINIAAVTGSPKARLDVRVTDFCIRADAIPGAEMPEKSTVNSPITAPTADNTKGSLIAMLLLGFTIVAIIALGYYLRKRGKV